MTAGEAVRNLTIRRRAARAYRDNAARLLDRERAERAAGHALLARYARRAAEIAIRAARAEEVNP